MRNAVAAAFLLLIAPSVFGGGPAAEEHKALVKEWEQAYRDYHKRYDAGKTDAERKVVRESFPKPIFQDRFMELARRHPKDPDVVDSLRWVLINPWSGPQAEKNYAEAVEILGRDFLDEEKLADACGVLGSPITDSVSAGGLHSGAERLLRTAMEKSASRRVRGTACFSLAWYLRKHSGWRTGGMSRHDAESMAAESVKRFEQVVDEFADVKGGGSYTLGGLAETALFEIRNLTIGKVAPEITGDDLEGRPLKLSDYRGKVVVLNFWATWCGPCMAMVPHERSLVKRLEGKPFALLGLNGDADRATAERVARQESMTWPSWWDRGAEGPTIRRWNVVMWPTIYVLDPGGVIRYKNIRGQELDDAIDALLKESDEKRVGAR
ncbi:MAG: TlpA disulfide reductase family protein [Paludisphaera borealis]|uniref:TlpA family protein disulfide reductase n=1 Tax=Paludisphaera borealis TaxID=1387353 RepID=UPI0028497C75|nr:TlpA disulfide reductase family protein [Paludisphaera borealis]MDR3621979.1 TlpA disulfide reductase family protein [Paludisphaera borealis]